MAKVERAGLRWSYHHSFNDDSVMLIVRYKVEGHDKQLWARSYFSPGMLEGDEGEQVKAAALRFADENAQWCADHPDEVPTYSPELVFTT